MDWGRGQDRGQNYQHSPTALQPHQARDHQGSSTDRPTQASHRAGTRCHGREVRAQGEGSVGGREDPDLGQRIAINRQGQPKDTGGLVLVVSPSERSRYSSKYIISLDELIV